ncbi:MAG TPA: hypothetical protein VG028_21580 [Terriglobia bacterium]|nr:hypothetical protein [Terriglobia bacterium]
MKNQENSAEPKLEAEIGRVVEDFRTKTLETMEGQFNRLIYIASLRDYNTARYHHYGLETRHGSEAVDEGLRRCHISVFEELMALPLQDQARDLIQFFESVKEDPSRMIEAWQRLRSFQILPPADCHPLARQLFDKNMEVLLRILQETDLWALLHEPHSNADHLA